MNLIQQVLDSWRHQGVQLNPPAQPSTLDQLQEILEVQLPPDTREFYGSANGMPDGESEESIVSFWSIEKILEEWVLDTGNDQRGPFTDIAFADTLINSWFFNFRLRPAKSISIFVQGNGKEIPSFEEFWTIYLTRPRDLCL